MPISDELLSEAMLRYAVIENHKRELEAVLPGEENLTFSEAHERRMRAMFARERARKRFHSFQRYAYRAVAAIAIVLAIAGGVLMTSPSVRAAVRNTVVSWYETFVNFTFHHGSTATPHNGIDYLSWEPQYLPERFSEIYAYSDSNEAVMIFSNAEGSTINFVVNSSGGMSLNVDNEHADYSTTYKNGIEFHVLTATDSEYPSYLMWSGNGYDFMLSGTIPIEELWNIALSVSGNSGK